MRRTAVWRWGWLLITPVLLVGAALAQTGSKPSESTEPAWLGVYTQELTDDLREAMGLHANGALVSQVVDGSPADRAGLLKGDVILTVNDRAVESPDAFTEVIRSYKAGDKVAIRVFRDNSRKTLSVTLGARSEWSGRTLNDDDDDAGDDDDDGSFRVVVPNRDHIRRMVRDHVNDAKVYSYSFSGRGRLGVHIQDLNRDLGAYFQVPDGKGVLVLEVVDDSPAEEAGLRPGDVIVKVGDDPVADSDDLVRELREREGKVSIEIMRRGARQTVQAELEQPRSMRGQSGPRVYAFDQDGPSGLLDDLDEDIERELRELRRELDQLREELRELRRK